MKTIFSAIQIALILLLSITSASAQDDYLNQMDQLADEMIDLLEKYEKAEIDLIKTENFSIRDISGAPQDCDVSIFYNNGRQARFRTSNGQFEGNFNHGEHIPNRPLSIRLWNCACRPVRIVHDATWFEINEVLEKIRNVIEDEVRDKAQEQGKKIVEEGVKKVFEKLGRGASSAGFLSGFGYGAKLGQPIGDYITDSINQILNAARERNIEAAELLDDSPYHVNVGLTRPRGRFGNIFGTSPQLGNAWDVTVRCGTRSIPASDAVWTRVREPVRTPDSPRNYPPETPDEERNERELEEERERERIEELRERQRQQRLEREREERRLEEERRRRIEEEERKIAQRAREIANTCPICEPINEQIEHTIERIKEKQQEILERGGEAAEAEHAVSEAELRLQEANRKLSEFNNPASWVDSDGRRVTSTDLEVQKELARDSWQKYIDGELTADDVMDNWERQQDPEVHEEAKQRVKERLEEEVQNAEQELDQSRDHLARAIEAYNRAEREHRQLEDYKEYLLELLEECLKRCRERAEDIARGHIHTYYELLQIEPLIPLDELIDEEPAHHPEPDEESEMEPEEESDTEPDEESEMEPEEESDTEPDTVDETETDTVISERDYEGLHLDTPARISNRWSSLSTFSLSTAPWDWGPQKAGVKLDFATRGKFEDAVCDQQGLTFCESDPLTAVLIAFVEMDLFNLDLSDQGIGSLPLSAGLLYSRSKVNFKQGFQDPFAGSMPYHVYGHTNISSLEFYGHGRRDFEPMTNWPFSPSFSPFMRTGFSYIWNRGEFDFMGPGADFRYNRKHSGLSFTYGFGTDISFGGSLGARLNVDRTTGDADANTRIGLGVTYSF